MNIALLGFGNVGRVLFDRLRDHPDLNIVRVLTRRFHPELGNLAAADFAEIVNDDTIDIMGLMPGSGRSPRGGNGTPLQYSRLGNPMDVGA